MNALVIFLKIFQYHQILVSSCIDEGVADWHLLGKLLGDTPSLDPENDDWLPWGTSIPCGLSLFLTNVNLPGLILHPPGET